MHGDFLAGEPVRLVDPSGSVVARGIVNYDAADLPGLTRSLMIDLLCAWGADRKRITRSASKAEAAADQLELAAPALA